MRKPPYQGIIVMLELYNFQQSTCSQKVRFVLAEKNLEWVDKRLDSRRGEHLKPDYLAINPNGLVPSLIHDDAIILDSSVIMEYLDEIFHDVSMVPENPVSRAHLRKWLRYMEEIPTPAIRYPSFQKYLIRSFKHLDDEAMEAQAKRRPLRTEFYRRMGTDGFTDIEFNPKRGINCQARACALYVALSSNHLLEQATRSPETFVETLREFGYGTGPTQVVLDL